MAQRLAALRAALSFDGGTLEAGEEGGGKDGGKGGQRRYAMLPSGRCLYMLGKITIFNG